MPAYQCPSSVVQLARKLGFREKIKVMHVLFLVQSQRTTHAEQKLFSCAWLAFGGVVIFPNTTRILRVCFGVSSDMMIGDARED